MVALVRHRQTKGSATDRFHLNHRATPRLHRCEVTLHFSDQRVYRPSGLSPSGPQSETIARLLGIRYDSVSRTLRGDLDRRMVMVTDYSSRCSSTSLFVP